MLVFHLGFSSGYHHVVINPEKRKYLGFAYRWPDGRLRFFEFLSLPFSLNSACYVFTKLKRWRMHDLKGFIYIDDGFAVCESHTEATVASVRLRSDLDSAGFVINDAKSCWDPAMSAQWLGFRVDSGDMKFYVTDAKLQNLLTVIDNVLSPTKRLTARQLAKFVGCAVSLERALGPFVRLLSRSAARLCAAAPSWDTCVQLDAQSVQEMRCMRQKAPYLNGCSIGHKAPDSAINCYADASGSGYGSYVTSPAVLFRQGTWSASEQQRSSTWRELTAVQRALVHFRYQLASCVLRWHCDNAAAVRILQFGSSKRHLGPTANRFSHSADVLARWYHVASNMDSARRK